VEAEIYQYLDKSLRRTTMITTPTKAIAAVAAAAAATAPVIMTPARAAEPTEKLVVFRTTDNTYATARGGGRLDTSSTKVGGSQSFVLVDLNGGELTSGDSVQIKWTANTKPTYWGENETGLARYGGKPLDRSTFKITLKAKADTKAPQAIILQTTSGKFVSIPSKGAAFATVASQDNAATLEIVDAPTPEPGANGDAE
jgi:hypothetical protein